MIVKWKPQRLYVLDDGAGSSLVLLPGNNEVDNDTWAKLRVHAQEHLTAENLIEINAETKVKKGKDGEDDEISVSEKTPFVKLPAEKAEALVAETFSVETLEKWKKAEGRDAVRATIHSQIEKVLSHGQKKKKGQG